MPMHVNSIQAHYYFLLLINVSSGKIVQTIPFMPELHTPKITGAAIIN